MAGHVKNDSRKKLVQVAAIVTLMCSAYAHGTDCAAGMDATGNACNGEPAVRTISAVESNLLYLKGAAMMASLRSMQAKQRQIDANDLPAWEARLAALDIAIESHVSWTGGGRSLYFRDPDGRSVELATPGLWPTY